MLSVYYKDEEVGDLIQNEQGLLSFKYSERALDEPDTHRISVRLPVRVEEYHDHECRPFFDNLLPESDIRDLIGLAKKFDPSDTILLLGAIGGECAGAISVWPEGMGPQFPHKYEACSQEQIRALFEETRGAEVVGVYLRTRQSLSGAQDKLVFRRDGEQYSLPVSGAPSNVILKLPKTRFGGLIQNELACMLLMEKAGLPVAESTVSAASVEIYESSRFDRVLREDGTILRLHQEDFCQATGKGEVRKYQERGGPDLSRIRSVLEKHSILPIEDVELLLRWMIANLCIGNNDAHAKNLALLYTEAGIRLAPVYDVVSTVVYPFIDQTLAIYFGGRNRFEAIDATAFNKCVRSLGYKKPSFTRSIAEEVAESIVASIREVCDFVTKSAGEDPILDEISQQVKKRCRRLLEVLQRVS